MPEELAANTTKPTKSMTEPHVMAMKQAPLKAEKPNQEEVEVVQVFPASPPPATQTQTVAANMPEKLPKTASPLPLIGLIGLLSLGLAGTLRFAASRMK